MSSGIAQWRCSKMDLDQLLWSRYIQLCYSEGTWSRFISLQWRQPHEISTPFAINSLVDLTYVLHRGSEIIKWRCSSCQSIWKSHSPVEDLIEISQKEGMDLKWISLWHIKPVNNQWRGVDVKWSDPFEISSPSVWKVCLKSFIGGVYM